MQTGTLDDDICTTCKGRGKQAAVETLGEMETTVWRFCEACEGRGVTDTEDGDFSIGDGEDDE